MASFKRRGQLTIEIILLVVLCLILGLVALFAHMIQSEINTEVQADENMNTEAKASLQASTTQFPKYMDNAFLIFLVLFWIFLLVSSYFIDTNPAFFVISIILLIIILIGVVSLSNMYGDITTESEIASFALDFPKTNYIMNHLVLIITIIFLSTGLVLYAKN